MATYSRSKQQRGTSVVYFIFIILSVFTAFIAFSIIDHSFTQAQAPLIPVNQSIPGVTNLDVVLVIDQSGSMWTNNDAQVLNPDGSVKTPSSRIVAAELLGEWLATDQSGAHHQLSVVMFGYEAKVAFPLQEIQSPQAQAAYKQALLDGNKPMGGTNILEALRMAKAELDKGRTGPNNRKVLIFLSDGVCEPADNTTDAQRKQCEQDIRTLVQGDFGADKSGSIFTIAISSDAFKQDPTNRIFKNLWQEMSVTTGGDYYELPSAGPALLDSFVKIMQRLFGLPIQSPPAAVDAPVTLTADLPPNLQQVGFTFIKYGAGISVTLNRPDGSTVDPAASGVRHSISAWTEIYNIARPPGGKWAAHVFGSGKVVLITVPFTQQRYVVERDQPADAHPQGKPMDIQVRVLDANLAPQSVGSLQVDVQSPQGTTVTLPLGALGTAVKAAVYATSLPDTQNLGTYNLTFNGAVQDSTFSIQQSVRVVTAPWLRIVDPQPGATYSASLPIPVRVQVMMGSQPLGTTSLDGQLETVVRLVGTDGAVVDQQFLHPFGSGIYTCTVTAPATGVFFVNAQLNYSPSSGEKFQDVAQSTLDIQGIGSLVVPSTPTIPPPTQLPPATPSGPQQVTLTNDLTIFIYALAALGALVVLALLVLAVSLGSLRKAFKESSAHQDMVTHSRPGFEANLHDLTARGWHDVAAQVTADALHQTVAVDRAAGILDAVSDPCPRFTIMTCDGREVTYTTNPQMLRRMKLVHRQDRVVDVSALSKTRHADAGMLWHYALAEHGRDGAFPPSTAHWYVVVRRPGARAAGMQAMRRPHGWFKRLFSPRGGARR